MPTVLNVSQPAIGMANATNNTADLVIFLVAFRHGIYASHEFLY